MHKQQFKNYVYGLAGQGGKKISIGGVDISNTGSGISPGYGFVRSNAKPGTLSIHRLKSEKIVVSNAQIRNSITGKAYISNSGYEGQVFGNLIYSPYYRQSHSYIIIAHSGTASDGSPTGVPDGSGFVRYCCIPDEPETFLFDSFRSGEVESYAIRSGADSMFFRPSSMISNHASYGEFISGANGTTGSQFELLIGLNNEETVTVTGRSGNFLLLTGEVTGTYPKGERILSKNSLHLAPSGETGYAQKFQVRVATGIDGENKFFIAGSGVTGGCHLGGTFTGEGYTFYETPIINAYRGFTYYFNQHHSTNSSQYIMFSYTSGGHREGGEAITGDYEIEQGGSNYCFNNYCHYHCPDEQTFMVPITGAATGDKIYYYSSGADDVGGSGYLNIITSGDGGN